MKNHPFLSAMLSTSLLLGAFAAGRAGQAAPPDGAAAGTGLAAQGQPPASSPSAEPSVQVIGPPAPDGAPVVDVEMTARKYEFTPNRVTVPRGTRVRFHLTALDREHGFRLDAVEGSCVSIKPGQPVTVEYYAGTAGEFGFACCRYCGFGHRKMKGTLVVQ
jgi:cytochrome c oxidase subunit 2